MDHSELKIVCSPNFARVYEDPEKLRIRLAELKELSGNEWFAVKDEDHRITFFPKIEDKKP